MKEINIWMSQANIVDCLAPFLYGTKALSNKEEIVEISFDDFEYAGIKAGSLDKRLISLKVKEVTTNNT